jgi:adenylate cyclase
VKNIARPVRVYRVGVPRPEPGEARTPHSGKAPAAAHEKPDKPSIAVLPFNNMSGDPEQEFFADGITEDLITELSRFRELFVISRNSSFKYKGKPVEVHKFARELGVQYVVEGSVRKAGNRVRITVQLIDAESDRHLWAERYDRELADIFAIQDEVTRTIVAILPGRVEAAARDRAARKPTDNMAAYECVITGKLLHHRSNREDNARALKLLERAIQLDPSYAHAHAWKACVLGQSWVYGWCADRQATFDQAQQELRAALALDDNDSDVHRVLAASSLTQGLHEKSFKRITQPDFTHHAFLAACHAYLGNEAQAKEHARQVLAREPKFTVSAYLEALRHYKHEHDREHHRQGLLKAGLPA